MVGDTLLAKEAGLVLLTHSNHFVGFNSVCPIADHDMLTAGRSARDLLRKKNGTSAAWSKKKHTYHAAGNLVVL